MKHQKIEVQRDALYLKALKPHSCFELKKDCERAHSASVYPSSAVICLELARKGSSEEEHLLEKGFKLTNPACLETDAF